jgi:hypothetical protein
VTQLLAARTQHASRSVAIRVASCSFCVWSSCLAAKGRFQHELHLCNSHGHVRNSPPCSSLCHACPILSSASGASLNTASRYPLKSPARLDCWRSALS